MGWFSVFVGVFASFLFWQLGKIVLLVISIICVIGSFWSWGIMHNYATEAAKKRGSYTGGFFDFTNAEMEAVPNWITEINMGISILSILLVIVGILLIIFR